MAHFMAISMIGIDHKNAPIDIRGQFSFTHTKSELALLEINKIDEIDGVIIISTCNRIEIWVSSFENIDLRDIFLNLKGLDYSFKKYLITRYNEEAITHLFKTACGLNSSVIGDDQILTQVKDSLSLSRETFTTSKELEVLFRMAITVGKKVKTAIQISHGNKTAISSFISYLHKNNYDFSNKKCLVIGNGEMGKISANALSSQGAEVTVTLRQYRSGKVLIPHNCNKILYGNRLEIIKDMDIIVSATASPNKTLTYEDFVKSGYKKGVILIDLAVPRDIDSSIKELSDVHFFDLDELKVEASEEEIKAINEATILINEQIEEYLKWYEGKEIIPIIEDIQKKASNDTILRLTKILNKTELDENRRSELSEDIKTSVYKTVGKLLFHLRDNLDLKDFKECINIMEDLYED